MDQQKIDRLFREKLDGFEASPSPQAWSEVERRIGAKKSTSTFYWIAASISAIIVSWIVWPTQPANPAGEIAGDVNHPAIQATPNWEIPVLANSQNEEKSVEEENAQPQVTTQSTTSLVAQVPARDDQEEQVELIENEATPNIELETQNTVAVVDEFIPNPLVDEVDMNPIEDATPTSNEASDPIKIDLSKVKITYIAANAADTNEQKQEKDSVGALKKFIAFAGKISPGDVLADIRTKKDDFINNSLKTKQKDSSSL